MIVGLTGYAQHGKDTVASVLEDEFGFYKLGFADALREMAWELNPIIVAEPTVGGLVVERYRDLLDDLGYEAAKSTYPGFRGFLKDLGETARNVFGDDVWARAARDHMDMAFDHGVTDFVFTDVRYENEYNYIKYWGGTVVRVERPDFDNGVDPNHPSEAFIPHMPVDHVLLNDGTLEDLKNKVREQAGLLVAAL
jgi:hypothetical protein